MSPKSLTLVTMIALTIPFGPQAAGAPLSGSQPPFETLSISGASTSATTRHRDSTTGLTLEYPDGWKLTDKPEKDTLFKLNKGDDSEISFGVTESPTLSRETVARMFEEVIFPHLKEYKKVSEGRVRIGPRQNIEALSRVIRFKFGELPVMQRYFFFKDSGHVYNAIVTAPEASFGKNAPDFYKVLTSIALTGGTASGVMPAAARTPLNQPLIQPWTQLANFRSKEGDVSVYYPKSWKVNTDVDPDYVAKIIGKNAEGLDAEIWITRGQFDPNVPLEDVVQAVEDKYLKRLKNYSKLKQEPNRIGLMQGIYQESTFEQSGHPFRQYIFFQRGRDNVYSVSVLASGWKQSDLNFLFHKVLGSLTIKE